VDPDRLAHDGRPEWLHFLAKARASLRRDLEAQDPLAQLKALDDRALARAGDAGHPRDEPETVDPLQKLKALYEKEMGGDHAQAKRVASGVPRQEVSAANDVTGGSGALPASLVSARDRADPLEELKALEAAGSPQIRRDDADPEVALPSDDHVWDDPLAPTQQRAGGELASDDAVDAVGFDE
jgi:hypothetical protein